MKLINELKKQENNDKPKCEIKLEKYINGLGESKKSRAKHTNWNFISIIAHIDSDRYIFEAYYYKHQRGTDSSRKYIGTWNGVEQ